MPSCSMRPAPATGVIRRHPDIKLLRRAGDVAGFVARQLATAPGLLPLLRPGGRLLYVTCSILPEENVAGRRPRSWQAKRGIAERIICRGPGALPAPAALSYGWQLLPGARRGRLLLCLS